MVSASDDAGGAPGVPLEELVEAAAKSPTAGSVDFIFGNETANYAEYNRNGDLFLPGAFESDAPRIMMAGTSHADAAVGVGTLYRDGDQIGMRAEFLDNPAGQHERMLIKALGDGARYSFRGRGTEYSFHRDVPGVVYHKVSVYEACLVMRPAGGDKTYTRKVS